MTHVSPNDDLPPKTAPLAVRLRAAMKRSDYKSARSLALELGMADGSLVGKWRNGRTRRITSEQHLKQLPRLLKTPEDYFRDDRPRSEALEDEVAALTAGLDAAKRAHGALRRRVLALEKAAESQQLQPRRQQQAKRP